MPINTRTIPSRVQFAVGRDPAIPDGTTTQDHIFERIGNSLGDLLIEVTNLSRTRNLTLEVHTSATNRDADYAMRQIRVNGTLADDVVVQPLQSVTVVFDSPAALAIHQYFRFRVSNQLRAWGVVTISHTRGQLERRSLFPPAP